MWKYGGSKGSRRFRRATPTSIRHRPKCRCVRALVQSADGLLIATPEYAHGLPGTLKNALDWLVGTGELYGKRVVIVSAAPSSERAAYAGADLERTLRAQGANVLASSTIAVPTRARGREIDDPEIVAAVEAALVAFVPAPEAS